MIKKLAFLFCLLFVASPAFAAWSVVAGSDATCTTCGKIEAGKTAIALRVKVTGDGSTTTEAENLVIPGGNYQGKYLYDVTIVNPASGGASGTWNLVIQDTETGKTIISEDNLSAAASAITVLPGSDATGKYEKILGLLRIVSSDADLGNTEYAYLVLTFID